MKRAIGLLSALILVAATQVPVMADNHGGSPPSSPSTETNSFLGADDGSIAAGQNATKNTTTTETKNINSTDTKSYLGAEDGSVAAGQTATKNTADNSTRDSHDSKYSAEQGGIAASGAVTSNKDSGNTETDVHLDYDKKVTTTTTTTSNTFTIGDISTVVMKGDLAGEVSCNRLEGESHAYSSGDIKNKDGAFSSIGGITVVKQNTGLNSLMQSNINLYGNIAK